jgi:uronate dehydrogenase
VAGVPETLLLTGAAGRVATLLRPLLRRPGRLLRLLDPAPPPDLDPAAEQYVAASVTDPAGMAAACAGVDLLVHLGGIAGERPWSQLLEVNIHGSQVTLEAAHAAGVRRVLLGSSNHAAGMTRAARAGYPPVLPFRPDGLYGVSKVAMEALGSAYADRYGMTVVSARMGSVEPRPRSRRSLSTWLSPADLGRLVEAVLVLDAPGHHIVNATSNNTRRWTSLTAGHAIGYHPLDDAEAYAGRDAGPPAPPDPDVRLGGDSALTTRPLGTPT